MLRTVRYTMEAIVLCICIVFFRLLPLDIASALGGLLARMIGPLLRVHHTAQNNIQRALPELSDLQRRRVLRDMWDNLGRVAAEYPHLSRRIMAKRITVEGREHIEHIKASGKGGICISGHFANWEIAPLTAALEGVPLVLIYRPANNPAAEWLIHRLRSAYNSSMFGKGREGARQALKALKNNQLVAMLADQKLNDGSPVPFFGRDAMTAMAPAALAIKQQVPIIAVQVVRTDGAHFHVTIMPQKQYASSADPKEVMTEVNHLFESWIRAHPGQWFWVHNRWGLT